MLTCTAGRDPTIWCAVPRLWSRKGRYGFAVRLALAALANLATLDIATIQGQNGISGRPMAEVDVIQLSTFGSRPRGYGAPDVDVPSPDGHLHAIVVKYGSVVDNTNIFSLLLLHTDELFSHPRPDTLLTLVSSSNRPAIESVRWLSDNRTVMFIGERLGELPQVYALDTQTRHLAQRTHQASELTHFDIAPSGDPIVYTTKPVPDTSSYAAMRAHGFALEPGQFVGDVLTGAWAEAASRWSNTQLAVTLIEHARAAPAVAQLPGPRYRECDANSISIAPSGRVALIRCTREHTPASWKGYTEALVAKLLADGDRLPEFALLDLERGTVTPLVDAPVLGASIRWSPAEESLVLASAFLPLAGADSSEQRLRAAHTGLVEVDVRTGRLTLIARRDSMKVVAWDATTNIVDFVPDHYGSRPLDEPRVRYQRTRRGWRQVEGGPRAGAPVLTVEQGINQPPRLVAVDHATHRRAVVVQPNPGLSRIRLGHVEVVHWRTASGDARFGGLYYPPDFVNGRRYPLVIQTHGFDSTAFEPDGAFPTAVAAQPMAAGGLLVLQIGAADDGTWIHVSDILTRQEAPRAMEEIESAIDHLDSLNLVDRSRVGLIGFSRSCYHVLYTLTHSRYPIAAAALSDGVDFSYLQYLLFRNAQLGAGMTMDEAAAVNGGLPWGKALDLWRERAPGFSFDRVTAPLRLEAIGLGSVLGEWEPYIGLVLQHKPVELFVIPQGEHLLVKPWERLASSQGNVDWFRFWLKGEEDPDPAKAAQYARWRELRKLQEHQTTDAATTRGSN